MDAVRSLVSDGGMSAPAWGFFTTLITIVGAILRELIKTRNQTIDRLASLEDRFDRIEQRIFGNIEYISPRRANRKPKK